MSSTTVKRTAISHRDVTQDNWGIFLVERRIWINGRLQRKGFKNGDVDTGVVYFIQAEDGPIKIGFSSRPIKHRLGQLRSHNAKHLELLATIAGNRDLEQRLHYVFKNGRIQGEWFKPRTTGLQNLIGWAQERLPV